MKKWTKRLFITGCVLTAIWACDEQFWSNLQNVDEGYQNRFDYQGTLEKKYAYNGQYQVELFTQEDSNERIKLLQVPRRFENVTEEMAPGPHGQRHGHTSLQVQGHLPPSGLMGLHRRRQ